MSKSISLALIVRNEAALLARCVNSFKGAFDELIIIDTGSTDTTISIARELGAKVCTHKWNENFAEARNASFDYCTSDFILWCDADDVLSPGHAEKIRWAAEQPGADLFFFTRIIRDHTIEREMLIRRGVGRWHRAIHEEFRPHAGAGLARMRGVVVLHLPEDGKPISYERNIRMLENATADTPFDLYYLATEHHAKGNMVEAKQYALAALPLGIRDAEKYNLLVLLALISKTPDEKNKYALTAYELMPGRREALVLLCQEALEKRQDAKALSYARAFYSQPPPADNFSALQMGWYGTLGTNLTLLCLRRNKLYQEAGELEISLRDKDRPIISLIHATRGRPEKMVKCRDLWMALAHSPFSVEHIFCVDADDAEVVKVAGDYPHIIMQDGSGGCVAAWNAGAAASSGQIFVQLSDDWVPPQNWDQIILDRLGGSVCKEAVLAVSDGIDRGGGVMTDCICLAIMTRERYQFQGHMFYRGYKSVYSDNEFTDRAQQDGIIVDARDVIFHHIHPLTGAIPYDATYDAQNHASRYADGEALYLSRKTRGAGLDRKYAAFILAAKDDFCLFEVIQRMKEEGVDRIYVGIPDEYWNGTTNTGTLNIKRDSPCGVTFIDLNVGKHRAIDRDPLALEGAVRNEMLDHIRADGYEHVLVVDGDELWKVGSLALLDRFITDNKPEAVAVRMIPVAGLPGYPIEGAQDAAMAYLGPTGKFSQCRSTANRTVIFSRKIIYHFTATRRTIDEIIQKHRESGHYNDPTYQFEEWFVRTLPNIKPGKKRCHMYTGWDAWPLCRNFTDQEWSEIPTPLHKYLGHNHAVETKETP